MGCGISLSFDGVFAARESIPAIKVRAAGGEPPGVTNRAASGIWSQALLWMRAPFWMRVTSNAGRTDKLGLFSCTVILICGAACAVISQRILRGETMAELHSMTFVPVAEWSMAIKTRHLQELAVSEPSGLPQAPNGRSLTRSRSGGTLMNSFATYPAALTGSEWGSD
jgi:hypothetical protein